MCLCHLYEIAPEIPFLARTGKTPALPGGRQVKSLLKTELATLASSKILPALLFTEHHQSHAASAFFPSPFPRGVVKTRW
ncbi:MAG: hypothetical protein GDA43_13330 [Hormoscilla sp. SP5CHS1]|nr:hypothetical protein [Hormoscilla sp. SP12CHS1]MBC6454052.1 hypothetical protein [Hormoscilla sp. SP5CHS1]